MEHLTLAPLPPPPVEANPLPLKDSSRPSTQTHTESCAGKAGDLSAGVQRWPTLRSRISSLLSIRFLQRSSSKYREASNSSKDTPINIIEMNISNSNTDMGSDRYSDTSKSSRDTDISSRNRDMDISSRNRDISSRNRDMDISSRNASINSSSSRPLQVNDHGVSTEKTQMMWRRSENDEQTEQADKQRGLPLQTIPLKAETPTDLHKVLHNRQFPHVPKPINSAHSSPASLQTQTEASPAEMGTWREPTLPSEGTSYKPSSQQDTHKVELSIQLGTVSKSEGCVSEQQRIVGHKTTTDQVQCKASACYKTEFRDKDRSMPDTWIPGPGEKESPRPNVTHTIEVSRNSTKDGPSTTDENKDSHEPILSIPLYKTHTLRLEKNDKSEVIKHTPGGAETENYSHHFSNRNKTTNTSGLSPIWLQTDYNVSEIHCDDLLNTQESVSTRQEAPVAAPRSPNQNDINKLFTEKSIFRASNKQVTSTASQSSKTVETSLDYPKRANGFATDISLGMDLVGSARAPSASHSQKIMAWRTHLSRRHSSSAQEHSPLPRNQGAGTNHQHAVPRLNSYPAAVGSLRPPMASYYSSETPLVKAKSCERLLQKAASVDSPICLSQPVSNMRSMSSSERINILAKHHAQGLKPGRDCCELNVPQLPHNQTRGRSYSTHEINSLQYSQIPLCHSGADNSQLLREHRSLTISNLTLPKYGLSKDRYPHQSKFSVFSSGRLGQSQPAPDKGNIGGCNQQYSKFRSQGNLSRESLYKGHSLDMVSFKADPVPNKKKRNYPSDMCQAGQFNHQEDHNGRSEIDRTDIPYNKHWLSPSYCKGKGSKRWSSVSELRNPEGHYRTQKHQTLFSQQQTFPKPSKLLLDSTGSQMSLDWSSESTDDDIFSTSPGQCRQASPPNYFTAYDKGLKPHHKSSCNVYQSTGGRANVYSSRSFDLSHGRSVSVSNVSSNRTAGLRRISTGSRTTTLSDLRDCEDFDDAISPKPRTLSCTLDQTVSSGPVQRLSTTGYLWRGDSLASSSGSLLSPSQVCLDSLFPSGNYYLTYIESEDSDSDTLSEGEYWLYGSGEDLESSL
ncbi:uncharacterized protein LOC125303510 isoform X2 [Alosa alosa]|uniref:uncharacterized protein LOC125303510 isoform X2 n=1 Tax=Alosa alosa TaxID=278164 RepID=UPI0020152827|nr:uncharacterized protein LOC125303510 isoform X2 [Alosa alosa]